VYIVIVHCTLYSVDYRYSTDFWYRRYCRDIFSPVFIKHLRPICSVNSMDPCMVNIISGLAEHCGEAAASCLPL
jgi:hypothetical protein